MDAHQAQTEGKNRELMAAVKANQEVMETLMDVSLETMEDSLENIEANHTKAEIMMEAYLEWKGRLSEHWRTDCRTSDWL